MISRIANISPYRQLLLDKPRVDTLGRQFLIQSIEIIPFSDLDTLVGGYLPETSLENRPA